MGAEVMVWAWSSSWVGALSPWISSCSPSEREFIQEFGRPAENGVRSLILKE